MTSAVGSAAPPVYAPPVSGAAPTVADDASTTTAGAATGAPTLSNSDLLAPSTVGALVNEQTTADAAATQATTDAATPAADQPYSFYQLFMPTRDGFSSYTLAAAVDDPDLVTSSAGKNADEIAADARSRLDATYAAMNASGKPFDYNSWEGVDWDTLMGDLDPKSLAAVANNANGLFTDQEQTLGQHFLQVQASFRTGGYNGPTRLMGVYLASGLSNMPQDIANQAMQSWDQEEAKKSSDVGVELGRASMRVLLGPDASASLFGDPNDRMLSLLVDALQQAKSNDPDILKKIGNVRTADDLEKQDWFQDHLDQFNAILDAANGGSSDKASDAATADASTPAAATAS